MTADELAEQVAEHFNTIDNPLVAFQATVPEEVSEVEKESSDYVVYVIPVSETETPIDRGHTCDERRTVGVIVNGPVKTVTKRTALQFCEQLRKSLYQTDFDGYSWAGNETTTLIDYSALKSKSQFLSRFDAEYFGVD